MTVSRPAWKRLIRFTTPNSTAVLYGEPVVNDGDDVGRLADAGSLTARVVEPGPQGVLGEGTQVSNRTESVGKLLAPVGPADVTDFKCIGLNYKKHSESVRDSLAGGVRAGRGICKSGVVQRRREANPSP
jgi:hypothetical protein